MKLPHLVVVDVETSGLNPRQHSVLEVAAIDLTTHEELIFVPIPVVPPLPGSPAWESVASAEALTVNRYYERRLWEQRATALATVDAWDGLNEMLDGNLIAGANPEFDASFLDATMHHLGIEPKRRHQTRDLVTYAAGRLGFDPAIPMRSGELIDHLGITNAMPHSAEGDARAAAEAFQMLIADKAPAGIAADLRASRPEAH